MTPALKSPPTEPDAVDALDREIVRATQAGLPLCPRPYQAIADQLGVSEDEVMARMQGLLDRGAVRRIAAVPNHYKLDVRANGMTVWDVADDRIAELGAKVGALDFVSHAYHRPRRPPLWPYNLFAMVHGHTRADVEAKVAAIGEVLGDHCRDHAVLYSKRILKKTGLRLAGREG